MKIEIDLTDEDIVHAVKSRARKSICDEMSTKISTKMIQEQIKIHAPDVIGQIIKDILLESEDIKNKVRIEIEKETKAKLKKLMG